MSDQPAPQPADSSSSAPPQEDRLPVAVVGCGRMGRLHARVYSQMPQVRLVGVFDRNPETAAEVAAQYGTRPLASMEEVAEHTRAATVAVSTTAHLEMARPLLERGVSCLIEKPLAQDVSDAREIVRLGRENGAVVQVGHTERFNPAVRALARLEVSPRFIEVTRISPMTFRSIDVGVVLDMMIHDIDIVLNLARSPVVRLEAQGTSILGDAVRDEAHPGRPLEDICNARLTFENGCIANLTASRVALRTERRLRIFSPEAYVALDYQQKQGLFIRRAGNLDAIRDTVRRIRSGEIRHTEVDYAKLLQIEKLEIDEVEPLRAQAEAFVASVTEGTPPVVSGEDGLAAVDIATRIVEAIPDASLD